MPDRRAFSNPRQAPDLYAINGNNQRSAAPGEMETEHGVTFTPETIDF